MGVTFEPPIKWSRASVDTIQAFFGGDQAINGDFSQIKILDPSRKHFYGPYVSHYPLFGAPENRENRIQKHTVC